MCSANQDNAQSNQQNVQRLGVGSSPSLQLVLSSVKYDPAG